jgi:hypothetical protein
MERGFAMAAGKRILLLGVYGMEMVECGGVLCKNARSGSVSHASIMFAGPMMRKGLEKSAEILGCSVECLDMETTTISASVEEKKKLMKVIRTFKPDIIITLDTEHCVSDIDLGRRPAMTALLEAMALAGRRVWLDEEAGTEPHRDFTAYYMTPEKPNCLVDIADVWDEKCRAMDVLESQLEFIGELSAPQDAGNVWIIYSWSRDHRPANLWYPDQASHGSSLPYHRGLQGVHLYPEGGAEVPQRIRFL